MRQLFIIVFILSFLSVSAQESISLWPDTKDDYRKEAVEFYHYEANASARRNTAIIFCPGGSYCYLAKKNEGHDPARLFAEYGFQTFVLIYRRGLKGNRYPSQIQDLQQAMIYVRSHAQDYGIDSLGVCGFSAGGHLVGTSATYFNINYVDSVSRNLRPDFAIMMYPVVTMQDDVAHRKSRRNLLGQYYSKERKDSLSLDLNVHADMPPIYLLVCKDDSIVDYHNALRMNESLNRAGVPHRLNYHEIGGHGFGVNPARIKDPDKSAADWHKDFLRWYDSGFSDGD